MKKSAKLATAAVVALLVGLLTAAGDGAAGHEEIRREGRGGETGNLRRG